MVTPFTADEAPSMENFNRRIEETNRLAAQVSEGAMPITGGISPGAFSVQGGRGPYSSLMVDSTVITLAPTGATSFSGKRLINVGEPVADTDAATKAYADSAGGGGGPCYATCATAYSTTAKVAACEGFELATGATVIVKFTHYNNASSPTLNVNDTGAKAIKKYGTTGGMAYMWYTGEMVQFVYDGTYWVMTKGMTATTSYYGLTKLSNSIADSSTTTAATPSAVQRVNLTAAEALALAKEHTHDARDVFISDEAAQALGAVQMQSIIENGNFEGGVGADGSPDNWSYTANEMQIKTVAYYGSMMEVAPSPICMCICGSRLGP